MYIEPPQVSSYGRWSLCHVYSVRCWVVPVAGVVPPAGVLSSPLQAASDRATDARTPISMVMGRNPNAVAPP